MPDAVAAGPLVAAVDCGTNSTRLLIATVAGGAVRTVTRRTVITRLGEGVDRTGRLSDAAIARVTAVLEDYARQWRDAGVERVGVSATSAVRDAADTDRFVAAVREATGTPPVVLHGEQEAELTFRGAVAGADGRRVVCDIGGGSTELIAGNGSAEHRVSLQLGSVRLRERHLHHDPPTLGEYSTLLAAIDAALVSATDDFAARDGVPLIAVAGTALTVAAVALRSADPDADVVDGAELAVRDVAAVVEELAWMPSTERLTYPPVVRGREDVIVAGAMLLARVLSRFGYAAVRVSVADLLDGMARDLGADTWPPAS